MLKKGTFFFLLFYGLKDTLLSYTLYIYTAKSANLLGYNLNSQNGRLAIFK